MGGKRGAVIVVGGGDGSPARRNASPAGGAPVSRAVRISRMVLLGFHGDLGERGGNSAEMCRIP